jgi:hypothetical protein
MPRSIDHPPIDRRSIWPPRAPLSSQDFWYTRPAESEGRILRELLRNGRQTRYGLRKALKMPISTIGSAIERLEKNHAVVHDERAVENGRNKDYYALTLRGLAQAIDLLYLDEDKGRAKADIARGFEVWASLCPEFFSHWNDLADDTKSPGASDYWVESVRPCVVDWYFAPDKGRVLDAIADRIWEGVVNSNELPRGDAMAALRGIPEIWDSVSSLLYEHRERMREELKMIDALLL